ncbi:MAG: hypothetical protein A4E28_01836 [Methanocella sp. PtaU1.Bin125]|nr:MAG: hypothetical protein A4E28_01836 [Methanocella sp. PtaU1.Bin125]
MAFFMTLYMPSSSISRMVNTVTFDCRSTSRSNGSRSRAPISTQFFSTTRVLPIWPTRFLEPRPQAVAKLMPWMLPEMVVSSVLKSPWASIQMMPIF